MTPDNEFPWRYAVACGVLWGMGVMLADTLSQPVAELWSVQWLMFNLTQIVNWSLTGVVWACGTKLAEASRHSRVLLILTGLLAWATILALNLVPGPGRNPFLTEAGGSTATSIADLSAYLLWINVFYGGLYVGGFFTTRRALRLGRRLAELRLARSEADARLREVRLQAFRGQMQPATLLEALTCLQRRYREAPGAGDALFDQIIAFLRAAMPGLRSGASTLSAELAIVSRYAELRRMIDAGRRPFRLDFDEPQIDPPFPSMRLLPALDRISRAAPPEATLKVTACEDGSDFVIRIFAEPGLTPAAVEALRAEARLAFGADPMAAAPANGHVLLELRLPLDLADPTHLPKGPGHEAPLDQTLSQRGDLPGGGSRLGPERRPRAAARLQGCA